MGLARSIRAKSISLQTNVVLAKVFQPANLSARTPERRLTLFTVYSTVGQNFAAKVRNSM
jgi:hypothetical protein